MECGVCVCMSVNECVCMNVYLCGADGCSGIGEKSR